jgi:2-polyprenyl-6-methoxyphenol hydroxylase-like FAD-dependent oxidoreductase
VRAAGREATVLVIGAGIAGLLAAAALSPHVRDVLLVETDALADGPGPRGGVPQGAHSHVLLVRGRAVFEKLMPGLDAELAMHVPDEVDWTRDCIIVSPAGEVPRFPSPIVSRPCTRPLLEWCVRRRVAALPNVRIVQAKVDALLWEGDRVVGVACPHAEMRSTLVIDASGRRSRMPEWLQSNGFRAPEETVVNAHLGYATRTFARTDAVRDWKGLLISTRVPHNPRSGVLWPIENDQWLVTLGGMAKNHPPTDTDGFLAFARGLASPLIHDAIATAQPTSKIHGFRNTENRWRHYERLVRMPEGLLLLGDGICAFNPIYGQGMTVAALQAEHLAHLIATRTANMDGLWRAYRQALPRIIEPAWLLATSEDCRWPSTEGGDRGVLGRAQHWYIDRFMDLTPRSAPMVETFLSVMHMARPPSALAAPAIVARVLTNALASRFSS